MKTSRWVRDARPERGDDALIGESGVIGELVRLCGTWKAGDLPGGEEGTDARLMAGSGGEDVPDEGPRWTKYELGLSGGARMVLGDGETGVVVGDSIWEDGMRPARFRPSLCGAGAVLGRVGGRSRGEPAIRMEEIVEEAPWEAGADEFADEAPCGTGGSGHVGAGS